MDKLSYHTSTQLLRALKQEYYMCLKSLDLLNKEEISIRLEDIKKDVVILTELINEYESNVNRGKTIIKGVSK